MTSCLKWLPIGAIALAQIGAFSSNAQAGEIRCNHDQSVCFTERRNLVVGDEIAILNSNDQVVAKGVVEAIKGVRRVLHIDKKFGPIQSDDHISLVDKDNSRPTTIATVSTTHPTFEKPAKLSAGGSLGLATLRSGEGLPAYFLDGFAEWRMWRGIRLVGGGAFMMAQGTATKNGGQDGISSTSMNVSGIAAYPGIAYKLFESASLSPKIEADLGGIFVSGAVNGTAEDFDAGEYNSNMKNGLGLFGRLKGGVSYQMGSGWFFDGGAAAMQIQNAMSTSLFAGATKTLQ